MFSFSDPQFETFLADWSQVLMTHPLARAVYYVGTSAWVSSDETGLNDQIVPNFVVRTEDPYWETFDGAMPFGRARHELINELDQGVLQRFYMLWRETGWTCAPSVTNGPIVLNEPEAFVRIIEVPASSSWFGPEKLARIPDGLSVAQIHQLVLRRFNTDTGLLDSPARYWAVDERFVTI